MGTEIAYAWQMWPTFLIVGAGIVLFMLDRYPIEAVALGILTALVVFFQLFPVATAAASLGPAELLAGFANPALITILALLVIGQGLFQSGALDRTTRVLAVKSSEKPKLTLLLLLLFIAAISAFLNNTPVAVMFIPVLSAIAAQSGLRAGKVMIPLSYMCILGGNLTLIGSSTNLLAANAASRLTDVEIGFFDVTFPGVVLASAGAVYTLFFAHFLLPDRRRKDTEAGRDDNRSFVAQVFLNADHPFVGATINGNQMEDLKDATIHMVMRQERIFEAPFKDLTLEQGDLLLVLASRETLTALLASRPRILKGVLESDGSPEPVGRSELLLSEAVVAPGSRMIGQTLQQIGFRYQTGCIVFAIQRRKRMMLGQLDEIRLESGDVLLILGQRQNKKNLRTNRDILLLEWSQTQIPNLEHARRAVAIFAGVVGASALGLVPIVVAALAGAGAMIFTGCINSRQAARTIDRRVVMLVASALAMASALEATGAAQYLALGMVNSLEGFSPAYVLSGFFLIVAILTNVLSNNATAVLFTPVAINTAAQLGVDPMPFIFAVIFAANCSFATPIGYQTNLLVMGPGQYRFRDFVRAGSPLVLLIWAIYSVFAPWYYGWSW